MLSSPTDFRGGEDEDEVGEGLRDDEGELDGEPETTK